MLEMPASCTAAKSTANSGIAGGARPTRRHGELERVRKRKADQAERELLIGPAAEHASVFAHQ